MMLDSQAFEGHWRLSRRIQDRLSNQEGYLSGEAIFSRETSHRLIYDETGELRLGRGPAMEAKRRYLWDFRTGKVDVSFDDGRPFHSFEPHGAGRGTDHPCGDDFYTVTYDFNRWPIWTAAWKVLGPRKDYTATSTYISS